MKDQSSFSTDVLMSKETDIEQLILGIANEGFWDWNLKTDQLDLSPHYRGFTGYSQTDTMPGTDLLKLIIQPDDYQDILSEIDDVLLGKKEISCVVYRIIKKDGAVCWVKSRFRVAEYDEAGKALRLIGTIIDITDQKQMENELHKLNRSLLAISKCNDALLHASNEMELLGDICKIIVEIAGYKMAWVGYAEQDKAKSIRPVAQAGFEDGYLDKLNLTWADTERGRGPTGVAIRTGEPCVSNVTDSCFD
jgi:PAS domain S-box-containing protein